MAAIQIRWSTLFKLTELEFVPEAPKVLKVLDELQQSIAWLTAATGYDRKLLRCTEQGALLTAGGWSNLAEVETHEAAPASGVPDVFNCTVSNKGVLLATSTGIVLVKFRRTGQTATEDIYLPPEWLFWYPYSVDRVTIEAVPAATGGVSYVGETFFN